MTGQEGSTTGPSSEADLARVAYLVTGDAKGARELLASGVDLPSAIRRLRPLPDTDPPASFAGLIPDPFGDTPDATDLDAHVLAAYATSPTMTRLATVLALVENVGEGDVARLLDESPETVTARIDSVVASARAAMAGSGSSSSPLEELRRVLVAAAHDHTATAPGAPAKDQHSAPTVRPNRRLVLGGAAGALLVGGGIAAVAASRASRPSGSDATQSPSRTDHITAGSTSGVDPWADLTTWPARGSLAHDPRIVALVADSGARLLYADTMDGAPWVVTLGELDPNRARAEEAVQDLSTFPVVATSLAPDYTFTGKVDMFLGFNDLQGQRLRIAGFLAGSAEAPQIFILSTPSTDSVPVSRALTFDAAGKSAPTDVVQLRLTSGVGMVKPGRADPYVAAVFSQGGWWPVGATENHTFPLDTLVVDSSDSPDLIGRKVIAAARAQASQLTGLEVERLTARVVGQWRTADPKLLEYMGVPGGAARLATAVVVSLPGGAALRTAVLCHAGDPTRSLEPLSGRSAAASATEPVVAIWDPQEGLTHVVVMLVAGTQARITGSVEEPVTHWHHNDERVVSFSIPSGELRTGAGARLEVGDAAGTVIYRSERLAAQS